VPTLVAGDELFWDEDSTEMMCEFLDDPALFRSDEFARLRDLPATAGRSFVTRKT
jgi:hypothetical protein